jgi:hypothetical protein
MKGERGVHAADQQTDNFIHQGARNFVPAEPGYDRLAIDCERETIVGFGSQRYAGACSRATARKCAEHHIDLPVQDRRVAQFNRLIVPGQNHGTAGVFAGIITASNARARRRRRCFVDFDLQESDIRRIRVLVAGWIGFIAGVTA